MRVQIKQNKRFFANVLCGFVMGAFFLGCNPPPEGTPPPIDSVDTLPVPSDPKIPAGMALVPSGTFLQGSSDLTDAQPIEVKVDSFYLDQTEVTAADYQKCIDTLECKMPIRGTDYSVFCNYDRANKRVVKGKEDHPINCLSFVQAKRYCQVQGKRLPTEKEWEYAALGSTSGRYPFGNASPSGRACVESVSGTCAVKSYDPTLLGMTSGELTSQRLLGVYDLAGNVFEWIDTQYEPSLLATKYTCTDDCVIRGGAWPIGGLDASRSALRNHVDPINADTKTGFRCAKDK